MESEGNIWEVYKRTVKPVKAKRAQSPVRKNDLSKATARANAEKEAIRIPKRAPAALALSPLERRREKALRLGELEIEAKLDLHGLTRVEAFEALSDFMKRTIRSEKRHLLVITGKGGTTGGILRRNLKNWLGQLPEAGLILALRPAAPKHGGDGAFYIVMRKSHSKARFSSES